ncbi:PucR family transcriptional regulator [Rhodococcus sp. NPDC060176]|uniref:PucR family transcriptional regulator n=1 Tax=Rhodococcus sp. NPDC060176 TaxID=3347062 RepID=UPI003668ECE4
MALTVRELVRSPALRLSLVAGHEGQDRSIKWAHSSELSDPSPFLSGGELVLTTGISVGNGAEQQDAYVRRLARANPAALAVDTGTVYAQVPEAIRAVGDELGLPVLRVPRATPFIAITRAVVDALTLSRVSALQHVIESQDAMSRSVVRFGAAGVAEALAHALPGVSVVVVGPDLRIVASQGPDANHAVTTAVAWAEQQANSPLRRRSREITVDGKLMCSLQRIAVGSAALGYLAVVSPGSFDASARRLIAHAHVLIASAMSKPARVVSAEHGLRTAVTLALIKTHVADPNVLGYFGFDAEAECVVIVTDGLRDHQSAERTVAALLTGSGTPHLMAVIDGVLVIVLTVGGVAVGAEIHDALVSAHGVTVRTGQSAVTQIDSIVLAVDQARVAARSATSGRHTQYGALDAYTTLLRSRSVNELGLLAQVLTPLERCVQHDSASDHALLESLVAYLEHDGQIESTARALDVHRHTLRSRLARIREVLGGDIDSTHRRAELWTAIKAREAIDGGADFRGSASGAASEPSRQL